MMDRNEMSLIRRRPPPILQLTIYRSDPYPFLNTVAAWGACNMASGPSLNPIYGIHQLEEARTAVLDKESGGR